MLKGLEEGFATRASLGGNREREAEEGLCVRVDVSPLASSLQ